jgi:flagellin
MRINTNVEALNGQRNLTMVGFDFAKSVEKLSSGYRINRAGDDAAGLAISEKLRAQVRGLNQASRNAQDGISMIQTAEGALNETHSMLQRMRELAVQASNDTLSLEDRQSISDELTNLREEVNEIAARTTFNGKSLLTGSLSTSLDATSPVNAGFSVVAGTNTSVIGVEVGRARAGVTYTFADTATGLSLSDGTTTQNILDASVAVAADGSTVLNYSDLGIKVTLGSVAGETAANIAAALAGDTIVTAAGSGAANFQVGANASDDLDVSFTEVRINATVGGNLTALDTALTNFIGSETVADAQALITAVDNAIVTVNDTRGNLGAYQNRLEHTIANLNVSSENLSASESRIRDVDMAAETVKFTRAQILRQAGTSVLAQANQAPQGVLSLLR